MRHKGEGSRKGHVEGCVSTLGDLRESEDRVKVLGIQQPTPDWLRVIPVY